MEVTANHSRIETPLTNEHFAAFCEKMLGQPYWYGCCLYKCSSGLLTKKAKQYPKAYTSARMARYNRDIANRNVCADCIGAAKGYAWTNGGIGILEGIGNGQAYSSKYASNNCPDKGANSMFTYAKGHGMQWGEIGSLPETVGLALFKAGHAGYYIGSGFAIEWKGFAYGCVKTAIEGRGWTHWYQLPFLDYGDDRQIHNSFVSVQKEQSLSEYGTRLLRYPSGKNMMRGNDVLAVQERLIEMGYDPGATDGIYGLKTMAAVMEFQESRGIKVDGIVGPITRSELVQNSSASRSDSKTKFALNNSSILNT